MQSVLECTVCTFLYHSTSRVPKTLACGHVFCVQCLWTLLRGCDIKCPKCRALTTAPLFNVQKLPTSFATIDYLESACEECRSQPWRTRCEDCSRNLCDSCLASHVSGSGARLERTTVESAKLKSCIVTLQELIQNDASLSDISSNGDDVIRVVKRAHQTRMELLRAHQEELVAQVKSQVKQGLEKHLSWRETSARALVEATILQDRCRSLRKLAPIAEADYAELNANCDQQARLLQTQIESKPHIEQIAYDCTPVDIEALIVGCGSISIQECNKLPVASSVLPPSDKDGDHFDEFHDDDNLDIFQSSIAIAKNVSNPEFACEEEVISTVQENGMNVPENNCQSDTTHQALSDTLTASAQELAPDYSDLVVTKLVGQRGKGLGEFNGPTGICQSALSGHIFVTDCNNHRVVKLTRDWGFVECLGRSGRGESEFMNPSGIVAVNGRVLVVDRNNHRIQVMDEDGVFLYTVGQLGSDPGEFCYPEGLALAPSGAVYVSDMLNNRLQVIEPGSTSGVVFGSGGSRSGTYISHPGVIACGEHQVLAGDDRGDLLVFSQVGAHIRTISIHGECRVSGVVFRPRGSLLVADRGGSVVILDWDGEVVCRIGQVGAGSGEFSKPEGLCLTEDGGFGVCDTDNHRIQVFGYLGYK